MTCPRISNTGPQTPDPKPRPQTLTQLPQTQDLKPRTLNPKPGPQNHIFTTKQVVVINLLSLLGSSAFTISLLIFCDSGNQCHR
jgi:hypothetical protein